MHTMITRNQSCRTIKWVECRISKFATVCISVFMIAMSGNVSALDCPLPKEIANLDKTTKDELDAEFRAKLGLVGGEGTIIRESRERITDFFTSFETGDCSVRRLYYHHTLCQMLDEAKDLSTREKFEMLNEFSNNDPCTVGSSSTPYSAPNNIDKSSDNAKWWALGVAVVAGIIYASSDNGDESQPTNQQLIITD